ncbi:hypothetical protein AcW1_004440 [Taiwanofungus camphoratus]|nr:hypothetical protein AcW1_004440 [Antrodia cinnamomea]
MTIFREAVVVVIVCGGESNSRARPRTNASSCSRDIPGPFPVGAVTFAAPLHAPQTIGSALLKSSTKSDHHVPALLLEEVAFTAYYPADIRHKNSDSTPKRSKLRKAMEWIPRPVRTTLRGYAHFAKMPYWLISLFLGFFARRLKIPVYPNVPLLDPVTPLDELDAKWPLVIFSHGLGGTRTNYSQICSHLASQGKVVLAIEHRDGTAPSVISHFPQANVEGTQEKTPEVVFYLHPEDVTWRDGSKPAPFALRSEQLLFRRLEIYLAYRCFSDIVDANSPAESEVEPLGRVHIVDGPLKSAMAEDHAFWNSWTSSGAPRVECTMGVSLVGHSFGGATVLSILSNPPPFLPAGDMSDQTASLARLAALPVTHVLALDPWLEPLPSPGPAPHAEATRDARAPKILVVNSEEFTLWKDHFTRVEDVVRRWRHGTGGVADSGGESGWGSDSSGAAGEDHDQDRDCSCSDAPGPPTSPSPASPVKLLTLVRARHIAFSDFGVLWPWGQTARDGRRLLRTIGELAHAFLGDRMDEAMKSVQKREMQVEWVRRGKTASSAPGGKGRRRLVGAVGDVIVH